MARMVSVYDETGKVVARVRYNNDLDRWDGSNMCVSRGCYGFHLGLTRLKDGRFVMIHSTDFVGDEDDAEIVSDEEALRAILRAKNDYLLGKYFPEKMKELKNMEMDD